jgi:prepilin-type N-terminal cleavage/methylation domain-containing protein
MTTKQNKGFTLLEILLVIAAIGILAAIVLVAINPNRQIAQARNTVRQADINTIQKAVEQYLIENGSYPSSISVTPGYICNTGTEQVNGSTNCSGRADLRELVPTYIAGIPKDPQSTGTNTGYIVAINPDNNKVSIQASLSERGILVINPLSIVTDGLVLNLDAGNPASYPGTGNTWFDLSGNGNNGTLVNGVGYNTANGVGLSFDGVNDSVSLNQDPTSSIVNSITYQVIVKFNSNSVGDRYPGVITKGSTSSTGGSLSHTLIYLSNSNRFTAQFGRPDGSAGSGISSLVNFNQYYIFSATYDGSNVLLYENGVLVSSNTQTGQIYNTSQNGGFGIGRDVRYGIGTSGRMLNGNIAQVSIYNRALTPEEIQQNFNATRGRFGL